MMVQLRIFRGSILSIREETISCYRCQLNASNPIAVERVTLCEYNLQGYDFRMIMQPFTDLSSLPRLRDIGNGTTANHTWSICTSDTEPAVALVNELEVSS